MLSPSAPRARMTPTLQRSRSVLRAYLSLTKTRIIEQLLVVTVPAMFLAERRAGNGSLP